MSKQGLLRKQHGFLNERGVAVAGAGKRSVTASDERWCTTQNRMPNQRHAAMLAKRIVDVVLASIATVLLLPVFTIIVALIKLDSKGAAIFKQVRIGKDGEPFTMYKFRTMYNGDNSGAHRDFVQSLFSEDNQYAQDTVYKVAGNGSITRSGALLRKTSLDELPQLINVLKGEMSLVGPRPDLPYSVELYNEHHFQRLAALPGITGLWQVSGRSKKSLLEMLDLDVAYVNNWSLWLDIKILARTIIAVITRQGAS